MVKGVFNYTRLTGWSRGSSDKAQELLFGVSGARVKLCSALEASLWISTGCEWSGTWPLTQSLKFKIEFIYLFIYRTQAFERRSAVMFH